MNIADAQAGIQEMSTRLDNAILTRNKKLSRIADLTAQQWSEAFEIMTQHAPDIAMKRNQLIGAKMLLQKMK